MDGIVEVEVQVLTPYRDLEIGKKLIIGQRRMMKLERAQYLAERKLVAILTPIQTVEVEQTEAPKKAKKGRKPKVK